MARQTGRVTGSRPRGAFPPSFTSWKLFDFSRLGSGPLYFYVGAGPSIQTGLVKWNEMACWVWWYLKHYERAEDFKPCPRDQGIANAAFLQDLVKGVDRSGNPILSRASTDKRALGRTVLLNLLFRYRAPRLKLRPVKGEARPAKRARARERAGVEPGAEDLVLQALIWRSGCSGVLTTNYDMLLEHAYSLFGHGAALRSYRYDASFLRYLLSNRRFVLKLHGDINDIGSMELDPEGTWNRGGRLESGGRKGRGEDLKRVYRAALQRGHVVYVGCGFRDRTIRELHAAFKPGSGRPGTCRIALIPQKEVSSRLREFRDIEFLTFDPGWRKVREFLERIAAARSATPLDWRPCPEASDLFQQLLLRQDPDDRPVQNLQTELWSCIGSEPERRRSR